MFTGPRVRRGRERAHNPRRNASPGLLHGRAQEPRPPALFGLKTLAKNRPLVTRQTLLVPGHGGGGGGGNGNAASGALWAGSDLSSPSPPKKSCSQFFPRTERRHRRVWKGFPYIQMPQVQAPTAEARRSTCFWGLLVGFWKHAAAQHIFLALHKPRWLMVRLGFASCFHIFRICTAAEVDKVALKEQLLNKGIIEWSENDVQLWISRVVELPRYAAVSCLCAPVALLMALCRGRAFSFRRVPFVLPALQQCWPHQKLRSVRWDSYREEMPEFPPDRPPRESLGMLFFDPFGRPTEFFSGRFVLCFGWGVWICAVVKCSEGNEGRSGTGL